MTKKCLVYAAGPALQSQLALQDEAEKMLAEGYEVHFAYCSGIMDYCYLNYERRPSICRFCRYFSRKLTKALPPEVVLHPLEARKGEARAIPEFRSAADIKKIQYRDANIGYGMLSTFISLTRNCYPEIGPEATALFRHNLGESYKLTDALAELLDDIKPELVSLYNGRWDNNRFLFDMAKARGIQLHCLECSGTRLSAHKHISPIVYDSIPQEISKFKPRIERIWQLAPEPEEEKTRLGLDFFRKRRGGIAAGDYSYTATQKRGELPAGWDDAKINIAIFNSSEDEFASVGAEYDRYSLFSSQREALEYLFSHVTDPQYHFYLRVHPNLKNIPFRYHTDLYELDKKYHNVTVIRADAPASTYDIMAAAEKVVVFGSTMGLESAYWGKPVILLAGAMYYDFDLCYTPKTPEKFIELVKSKLDPIPSDAFPMIGYYFEHQYLLARPLAEKYMRRSVKLPLLKKRFTVSPLYKFCGSAVLMRIVEETTLKFCRLFPGKFDLSFFKRRPDEVKKP